MKEKHIHKVRVRTDLVSESIINQSLSDPDGYLRQAMEYGSLYGENYSIFNSQFSKGFISTNSAHIHRFVTIDPTMATHRIHRIYMEESMYMADIELLDKNDEATIESGEYIMQLMPRALLGTRTTAAKVITFDLLLVSPDQLESFMDKPARIEVMIANEASYFRDDWVRLRSQFKLTNVNDPKMTVHMENDDSIVAFVIKDWRSTNDHKLYATVETNNFVVYSMLKQNPERACNHMLFIWGGHDMSTFAQTAENKYLSKMVFSIQKRQGATSKNVMVGQTEA